MEVNINAKHQVSQQHPISNSGGESEGLVKDLCVLWITALKRDRHAELIFQKKGPCCCCSLRYKTSSEEVL